MTLPRRTLLARIVAALAALSAPVVALGAGRRPWRRTKCPQCGASVAVANLRRNGERTPCWSGICDCGWYVGKPWRHEFSDAWGAAVTRRQIAETELREARGLLAEARDRMIPLELVNANLCDWHNGVQSYVPVPDPFSAPGLLSRIDKHLGRGAGRGG